MIDGPLASILHREEAASTSEQHLAAQLDLLRSLVDYGTHSIPRLFEQSAKREADVVVIFVLLKQLVMLVDAAEVLLRQGCGHAVYLPARAAFEASLYADWILLEDSERRARRYFVANFRDERFWASTAIPGTEEAQRIGALAQEIGLDIHAARPTLAQEAATHLNEVNRVLSQGELAQVDAEFSATRGRRPYDPEWYQLDGVRSVRQLAERLGRLAEYQFFYARGSQVIHSGSLKDHVRFREGQARLIPIRHLMDVNMLLNFVCSICISTYRKLMAAYLPNGVQEWAEAYRSEWREPFLGIPHINYRV